MREIIYRGKRKDNGELIVSDSILQYDGTIKLWDKEDGWVEIEPETVGQYTRLTDKNGTMIFDGDIIKVHKIDTYVIKYGEYTPRNYCLARYYDKPTIGFYAYDGERCFQLSTNSRCYEVIGNIHDNPELAEGML